MIAALSLSPTFLLQGALSFLVIGVGLGLGINLCISFVVVQKRLNVGMHPDLQELNLVTVTAIAACVVLLLILGAVFVVLLLVCPNLIHF